MCCITATISLAVFFGIFAVISSGPDTLLGFMASNCFGVPFSPISRALIRRNGDLV